MGSRQPRRVFKPVISARSKVREGAIVVRSRPEGLRWLRSDGTPNWSQRVRERVKSVGIVASKPAITVRKSSTVLEAAELIASRNVRGLIVTEFDKVVGVLMSMDIVNYLGGGEYYSIIVRRHEGNIYKALRDERVSSIMNPSPIAVNVNEDLERALELMISRGAGFIPVVDEYGEAYGVITEHDIVRLLAEKKVGVKISEVMTSTIVTVSLEDSLAKVAETMVRHGFRRLPVTFNDEVQGFVSAKGYASFFGSHRAFKHLSGTSIEEILTLPASIIMEEKFAVISGEADVGEACNIMLESGVNWLLVVRDGEAEGIITERDILVALALERG